MRGCANFSSCPHWRNDIAGDFRRDPVWHSEFCSPPLLGWWFGGKMSSSSSNLINALFIFVLAGFIGFEVIRRVSPLLHTPLMSLTNALDAIAVVGAIVLVGEHETTLSAVFGFIAVVAATSNIVGGFLITDRMLKMFKTSRPADKAAGGSVAK